MCLQHKSKLQVYWKVKVGGLFLTNILSTLMEPLLYYFKTFIQVPMGFLKSWVDSQKEAGPRDVLIVGFVRSLLSMSVVSRPTSLNCS